MVNKKQNKPQPKDQIQDYFVKCGLKEIQLLRKHFPIEGTGDEVHFTKTLSPLCIRNFYREYIATVRPPNLRLEKILPPPNPSLLRGLYIGQPDANVLLNLIVRHALYVDQIIISDPFQNPLELRGEHNVINHPEQWVQGMANKALCLCAIEDWIKIGIVLVIPHFSNYYPHIAKQAANEFLKKGFTLPPYNEVEDKYNFFLQLFLSEAPENRSSLFEVFARMGRTFTEQEKQILLSRVQDYEDKNPIRFRLPEGFFCPNNFPDRKFGQIINFSTGIALPLAYPIAEATGSFLIFENPAVYKELSNVISNSSISEPFEKLSLAFQRLDFTFLNNVPLKKALDLRRKGYLSKFRNYLRDLWLSTSNAQPGKNLDGVSLDFIDRLNSEYMDLEREWKQINSELMVKAVINGIKTGLSAAATGQVSLTMGAVTGLGLSLLSGLSDYRSFSKDKIKIEQNPLAIFIQLS